MIIILAIIAAVVATGLLAGLVMYPWIVAYWLVLTAKNIMDYLAVQPIEEVEQTVQTAWGEDAHA